MNFKEFEEFRIKHNLLFIIQIADKKKIEKSNSDNVDFKNGFADEVTKYRTERFNCGSTGLIICKLKIES